MEIQIQTRQKEYSIFYEGITQRLLPCFLASALLTLSVEYIDSLGCLGHC
jgi:hypothetical protein